MRYVNDDKIVAELCDHLCCEFNCERMAIIGECDILPTDVSCDNYHPWVKRVVMAMEAAEDMITEAMLNV